MTQLLPFVIFGIGLDDTFIVMGAYTRTDPSLDITERIHETVEEVGTSITLTTLTSTLAFGLGCLASIPAIYWLCLYAIPIIVFVYLYQITFFIAAVVLDERRVQADRRDKCNCCASAKRSEDGEAGRSTPTPNVIERFVEWYASFLMQPAVKVVVLVAFMALLALCAQSASQLTQSFDVADVMPSDSYVTQFLDAQDLYTARSAVGPYAYFRNIDQGDPEVQVQMMSYVDQLVQDVYAIPNPPAFFWLKDFQSFVQENETSIGQLSFNKQLDAFLELDQYKLMYGQHLVRDKATGNLLVSRVRIFMDNVVVGEVNQEIDALEGQSDVTDAQPINSGKNDYPFFMYDDIFQIWGK